MEHTFREQKSTLEVRPIYHQTEDNSMGHIVASCRTLRLEVDLQQRLEEREVKVSWPDPARLYVTSSTRRLAAAGIPPSGHRGIVPLPLPL